MTHLMREFIALPFTSVMMPSIGTTDVLFFKQVTDRMCGGASDHARLMIPEYIDIACVFVLNIMYCQQRCFIAPLRHTFLLALSPPC